MNIVLYQLRESTSCGSKRTIAVCSTKKKAQEKLKELVENPSCSQPLREECELEDEYGHVENKHGWYADYYIEPIILDDWID